MLMESVKPMQSSLVRPAILSLIAALAFAPVVSEARPHTKPPAAATSVPAVIAAEPEAAEAGMKVLRRGGTAIDAAVAIQATLGLVEPQSSGLGGGSFMLYYDAKTKTTTAYNGREKAPMSADGKRFLHDDGKPMTYPEALVSGRATGVPGAMFMLELAQKDHGKLKWSTLFDDPIALASNGFKVSRRLGNYLQNRDFPEKHTADFQAYFTDGKGGLLKTGDTLKNPIFANTLTTIARDGMKAYREGPLAEAIVAKINEAPLPGGMTLDDLKAYTPEKAESICLPYRIYVICEAPSPSGGPALLQALKILEQFPVNTWGKDDARSWAAFIEASRLMYADRDQYQGDPDFVPVPTGGLLDAGYIKQRAATVTIGTASPAPAFGTPPGAPILARDKTLEPGGTSHMVIIDSYGNALTMTTTVEAYFGTGRMAGGFFVNNQLTDFSWTPVTADGRKAANAVEPGKRPRSAMSPTMIFDKKGKLIALLGSPGGPGIIAYNLKTIMGVLDFHLSMQDAINLPNVVAKGDTIRVEAALLPPEIRTQLKAMGYKLTEVEGEESGVHGLLRQPDGSFAGGADKRRNGVVLIGK